VDAVKIGMLGSVAVARTVVEILREAAPPIIVLDPVLRASTGRDLLDSDALAVVRDDLMPLATVVTPNVREAGVLLGTTVETLDAARAAAAALVTRGARAALVTGGHLPGGREVVDVLHHGGSLRELRVAREREGTGGTHGTGCVLSSAIAALLARGMTLIDACAAAQAFVAMAIARSRELDVGRGATPVHPLAEPV
jgi:hydroxymethylpyrimidine/phosphomethylpyrimidine kinase